jgi:hypothetical protein
MATKKFLHIQTSGGMSFPENEPEYAVDAIMLPATKTQALAIPDQARAIIVRDQATLDAANLFLHDIDLLIGKINESFDPQISQAHKLHKSLLAEKAKFSDPLIRAKQFVGQRAAAFLAEQEQIRREAERQRLEAEEKARVLAEKAVERAEKLEANGKEKAAALVVNEAHNKVEEILGAAPEVPEAMNTAGLTVREDWKFSIVDHNLIPREYMIPDEKKIGRIVRAMKDQTNIPGVRAYAEKGVAIRSPRTDQAALARS